MDSREEKLGATGKQQRDKEPMPKKSDYAWEA
jgi:hypothetical protein